MLLVAMHLLADHSCSNCSHEFTYWSSNTKGCDIGKSYIHSTRICNRYSKLF